MSAIFELKNAGLNALLKKLLGGSKLDLCTSDSGTTPSGNNYAPVTLPASNSNTFPFSISNGEATNNRVIYFNDAEDGTWGTVTHLKITNGSTVYLIAALTASKEVLANDRVKFPVGSLKITLTQASS